MPDMLTVPLAQVAVVAFVVALTTGAGDDDAAVAVVVDAAARHQGKRTRFVMSKQDEHNAACASSCSSAGTE